VVNQNETATSCAALVYLAGRLFETFSVEGGASSVKIQGERFQVVIGGADVELMARALTAQALDLSRYPPLERPRK
jgi:predicted regulator of Ras-like GTPase activity (Roadblock/LC7/MglB family)